MMKVALLLVVVQHIFLVVFDDDATSKNYVMATTTTTFRRYERLGATGRNNINNDDNTALKMRLVRRRRRRRRKRWLEHDDENSNTRTVPTVPRGGSGNSGNDSSGIQQYPSPFLSYNVTDPPPVIFTEMESFIRNRCIPGIQNSTRKFTQRLSELKSKQQQQQQQQHQHQHQHQKEKERERDEVMENTNNKRNNKEQQQQSIKEKSVSESTKIKKNSTDTISFLPLSVSRTSATSALSSILIPSRIIKLSILSILLAEVLDRVGILYEDIPAILKTQCIAFWYYDIIPLYYNIKNTIGNIYNKFIRSLLPGPRADAIEIFILNFKNNILYDCDYLLWYTKKIVSSLKVAFAIGVSCGLIGTPVLFRWTNLYWKPATALYGLAEINHYCKRNMDINLFKVLGETPSTLGATINGILEQCRRLIRRTVFGQKQPQVGRGEDDNDYYLGYYSSSSSEGLVSGGNNLLLESSSRISSRRSSGDGDTNAMTTFGSSSNSRSGGALLKKKEKDKKNHKYKNKIIEENYSLGICSSSTKKKAARDDTDFQGLIDEFKGWMITHPQQQELYQDGYASYGDNDYTIGVIVNNRQRRAMIRKGFLVGCGIGLAILGSNVE